jgi:BMFP domain-containing protein YqiC
VLPFFIAVLGISTAPSEPLLDQGYNAMYDLRFDAAHKIFANYESARPGDPLGPVSDAAAYLFSEFDRLRILQSDLFINDKNYLSERKREPDPRTKAQFEQDLDKARRLAASEMQKPDAQANAMFAETLASGLQADYLALIERRDFAALSQIKKAREFAEKLLSSHPDYYDAYLAIGVENYLLSRKSAPIRWLLQASGAETNKQEGVAKLRLTAEHGHYLMPYARLLLAVAALRDGDKNTARNLLSWLAQRYPHNNLYQEELEKLR